MGPPLPEFEPIEEFLDIRTVVRMLQSLPAKALGNAISATEIFSLVIESLLLARHAIKTGMPITPRVNDEIVREDSPDTPFSKAVEQQRSGFQPSVLSRRVKFSRKSLNTEEQIISLIDVISEWFVLLKRNPNNRKLLDSLLNLLSGEREAANAEAKAHLQHLTRDLRKARRELYLVRKRGTQNRSRKKRMDKTKGKTKQIKL